MSQESRGNSQYLKTTILLANVVMTFEVQPSSSFEPGGDLIEIYEINI